MKEMRHRNVVIMELLLSGYTFAQTGKLFRLSPLRIRQIFEVMMYRIGFPLGVVLRLHKVRQDKSWLAALSRWYNMPNLTFVTQA